MGIYKIPTANGSVLRAVVTDDDDVINDNLIKLKSSLMVPVVGVDVKFQFNNPRRILILSSRTLCLVVSYCNELPKSVEDFTDDRSICFVGISSCFIGYSLRLGNLAARVLKKPSLNLCRCLKTLAGEVGVQWKEPPKVADEKEVEGRGGILFTQEEMEFLIHKAYYCSVMGYKLFGSLEE